MSARPATDRWRSVEIAALVALLALAAFNYARGSYGAVIATSIGALVLGALLVLTSQ